MIDHQLPVRFRSLLSRVVDLVAANDVEGLRHDSQIVLADPIDPLYWVREYPATVVALPDDAWQFADVYTVGDGASTWYVVLDVWTAEEGRSDLSLEAEIRETPEGLVVQVENIHVM
jgi:hypothetical protein